MNEPHPYFVLYCILHLILYSILMLVCQSPLNHNSPQGIVVRDVKLCARCAKVWDTL